ncbi:methionine--tRNA ligase [Mycoplasma sp. P36-A1]|uniref:methionine--tRNA ligase n=1 Tax=Mycoplasma sp. P36-A1 TaxID=3252900 RepID=UPI003C2CBA95
METKKTFYLTTPIYYPSDNLHIGHAYTTIISDCICRYKRERGYDVHFLTGTDEHGEKIQRKAEESNVTPIEYTNNIVAGIKQLWKDLRISNDDFIRTTESRHMEAVQKIFSIFLEQGDIYKGEYSGKYCIPCESFWTEAQLDENGNCPDCGRPVEDKTEETYFFKMSKYADRLVEYYDNHLDFIEPETRKTEMLRNFIEPGLEDLSVTRTSFDWGIPVLEDPSHVIYVWIDALANYITALGYLSEDDSLMEKYWSQDTEILQIVGKEIVRFHTIYWPIMLMALGLRLPDKVYAHGWLIMKDGKMSKSKGNVVAPQTLTERYGIDALRHYCLSQVVLGQDGTYTPELFVSCVNTDLANNLGNLLNRTVSMIEKYFDGSVLRTDMSTPYDEKLKQLASETIKEYEQHMDRYHVDKASHVVFDYVSALNKYIDETQPWVLAKDEAKKDELKTVLLNLSLGLRQVGILLKPFLLDGSQSILDQLNITEDNRSYESVYEFDITDEITVTKLDPIFQRLDVAKEVEYLSNGMK